MRSGAARSVRLRSCVRWSSRSHSGPRRISLESRLHGALSHMRCASACGLNVVALLVLVDGVGGNMLLHNAGNF